MRTKAATICQQSSNMPVDMTHASRCRCNKVCCLQGRLKATALCEASRDDVIASVKLFLSPANQTPVSNSSACEQCVHLANVLQLPACWGLRCHL